MQAAIMMFVMGGGGPPAPTGKPRLNPRVLGPRELLNPRTLLDLAILLLVLTTGGGA